MMQTKRVLAARRATSIHLLEFCRRYGTEAYINSTPAPVSEARPTSAARIPQKPGAEMKMKAAKCSAIMTQPLRHRPENGVCPRRAADANAHIKSATAARYVSVLQSPCSPRAANLQNPFKIVHIRC